MNLAVILSVCVFCSASVPALGVSFAGQQGQSETQSSGQTDQNTSAPSQASAVQSTPQNSKPASSAPSAAKPGAKPSAASAKNKRRKKTAAIEKCSDSPPAQNATDTPDATGTAATTNATSTPTVKCPPSKTVVRDGGISETQIQLVGGVTPEQAADQKSTTDQLVGSTQDNLKKIEGRTLNSSQEEMVNQIHQFLEQSKAAVAAGDIQRGHNLAMKAHLLSDELAKP